jgi:hypothetical protein
MPEDRLQMTEYRTQMTEGFDSGIRDGECRMNKEKRAAESIDIRYFFSCGLLAVMDTL